MGVGIRGPAIGTIGRQPVGWSSVRLDQADDPAPALLPAFDSPSRLRHCRSHALVEIQPTASYTTVFLARHSSSIHPVIPMISVDAIRMSRLLSRIDVMTPKSVMQRGKSRRSPICQIRVLPCAEKAVHRALTCSHHRREWLAPCR